MSDKQKNKLIELITPSWISGLFTVCVSLVLTLGVAATFLFNSDTQLKAELASLQNTSPQPALTQPGQEIPEEKNSLQTTWPLIGFWMVIGLAAYFVVESLFHTVSEAKEFKEELHYVHARPKAMIESAAVATGVRLAAVILWIIFIREFFKRILPYAIKTAHMSATDIKSAKGTEDALLTILVVCLAVHINIIFLRLVSGRTRVISKT